MKKRKLGRPARPLPPPIDDTPENVARAIFADIKPPDPSKRKGKSGEKKQR